MTNTKQLKTTRKKYKLLNIKIKEQKQKKKNHGGKKFSKYKTEIIK